MKLQEFLNAKPLYYDEIDYDRMPRVYQKIKNSIKNPNIIHLIGTNAKGTTGRFLATALYKLGYKVGHYTSPHIMKFNERVWLNSEDVSDKKLEIAHNELLNMLTQEDANSLSYFEYTTLLAMLVYKECDFIVLEAGLGGEHDATAVFEKYLTLVTPIGIDHEAFLGSTIKEIATTKLNAIQKSAILAAQPYKEVYDIAKALEERENINITKFNEYLEESDVQKIQEIALNLNLPEYLQENLKLSVAALKFLKLEYSVNTFSNSKLFGRLTKYRDNIFLDVGHNTLAAKAIFNSLKKEQYVLVYNSYNDKNYNEILVILRPIIQRVEIIKIDDSRIEDIHILEKTLRDLELNFSSFKKSNKRDNYLVFGSFRVVEEFLRLENE